MANIKEFSYNGKDQVWAKLSLPIIMEPNCLSCPVLECDNCGKVARGRSYYPMIRYCGPQAVVALDLALKIANCQPLKK